MLSFSALFALLAGSRTARADDLAPGLEKGDALLKKLPEVEPGFSTVIYFEAVEGDKTIGYGQLSVEAFTLEGRSGYKYLHKAVIKPREGTTIIGTLDADLDRYFCPARVSATRRVVQPHAKELSSQETVVLKPDELVLTKVVDGKEESRKMPRPGGALVFGMDFLLQRLDLRESPSFVLRELDFQEGRAVHQIVEVTRNPDGTVQAEVVLEGNKVGKQLFLLDARQQVVSFREAPLPVVSKRIDSGRFEEVKKLLGTEP